MMRVEYVESIGKWVVLSDRATDDQEGVVFETESEALQYIALNRSVDAARKTC